MATQLFLGERELRSFSLQEVSLRIRRAKELAGIDRLMIWTSAGPARYEPLVRICRDCAVSPYLWFAVLADAQGTAIDADELLLYHDGTRGYGRSGAWEGLGGDDESFLFCCPNRTKALQKVFDAYSVLLDRVEFGGVMLDRIRYPSAVNGLESVFGCYCEDCREQFREMFGAPLEGQRRAVSAFLARLGRLPGGGAGARRTFASLCAEGGLSDLFTFKARSVARVVGHFAAAARARGLEVGLDLYSPSLAPTVSQDYGLLSRTCNWLKPMLYCRAVGPAGLPLEVACLQRGLQAACPGIDPRSIRDLLRSLLPWDWPESEDSLLALGLPERTIMTELDLIQRTDLAPGVRVHAGVEAIRHPDFHIDITRDALERSLEALHGRADGLVASWNLLYLPDENLRAIGAFARQG